MGPVKPGSPMDPLPILSLAHFHLHRGAQCLGLGHPHGPSCSALGWDDGVGPGCQSLPCPLGKNPYEGPYPYENICSALNIWSTSLWDNWEEAGSKLKHWKSTDCTHESLGCSMCKFWFKAASPVPNVLVWMLAIPSRPLGCFYLFLRWESI